MKGYPKWICWIQGLLFTICVFENLLTLSIIVLLSGFICPAIYVIYWDRKPSNYDIRKREAAKITCTEENAAKYREAFKETMTQEEIDEINETVRLVSE